jgi:nucleoside-diphosphate-sugar epimerase
VVLDPSATERAFGWKAAVGFADMIRRQLDWYVAHGVSAIHSHLSAPAS